MWAGRLPESEEDIREMALDLGISNNPQFQFFWKNKV
jgi:hypothetical protein